MHPAMDSKELRSVSPLPDHKLFLEFADGERKIFDVSPYIAGTWMGMLADEAYFRQVRIHPFFKDTVMWPDEQDIAPHELWQLSVIAHEKPKG